ncbi:MAG TPA: Crp/Fnr family transcriptional regulator [Pyrinomonadaceae bacterium]|nr:Crp/Fnr family transcriptional regulator [Pyrinomonadaceae bacterium]
MSVNENARPPTENRILNALSGEEYERLAPHLEFISTNHGQILYQTNQEIDYVYFPDKTMISLVSQMSDGGSVEVGIVGFEGMAGLPFVLGVEKSPHETMVQIHDGAARMPAHVLREEFKRGGILQEALLRYTQSLLLLTSQVAACNRAHSVEERLARWLLMSQDRCLSPDLPLTHEFLSMMLGVRRAGVTVAALALQAEGLIHYTRGRIQITNREGLEEYACECYAMVKAEFDCVTSGTENAGGGQNGIDKQKHATGVHEHSDPD